MRILILRVICSFLVLSGVIIGFNVLWSPLDTVSASSPEIGLTENEGPGSNLKSLFAVFFITWMAFFAYLFFLSRRLRSMKQEIMELKKIINGNNSKK